MRAERKLRLKGQVRVTGEGDDWRGTVAGSGVTDHHRDQFSPPEDRIASGGLHGPHLAATRVVSVVVRDAVEVVVRDAERLQGGQQNGLVPPDLAGVGL